MGFLGQRSSKRTKRGVVGRIGISLFALPFFIPGFGLAALIAWQNWQALEQSSWLVVGARVVQVPTDSQKAEEQPLHYQYEFFGQNYDVKDGQQYLPMLMDKQSKQGLYRDAENARHNGSTLPCWVDPERPERHRLWLTRPSVVHYFLGLFSFSHGLLGLGLLCGQWAKERGDVRFSRELVSAEGGSGLWLHGLAVVFAVNAFGIPSALSLWASTPGRELPIPVWAAVAGLLVPVVLAYFLWRRVRRRSLLRQIILNVPGGQLVSGQSFAVVISAESSGLVIPEEVVGSHGWQLVCTQSSEVSNGKGGRSTNLQILQTLPVTVTGTSLAFVNLAGEIPAQCLGSAEDITWELNGKAANGLKLGPFPVHVAAGHGLAAIEFSAGGESSGQLSELFLGEGIRFERAENGDVMWHFSNIRLKGVGRTLLVASSFLLLCGGFLLLQTLLGRLPNWPLFVPFLMLVFGLLLAVARFELTGERWLTMTQTALTFEGKSKVRSFSHCFVLDELSTFQAVSDTTVNGKPLYHVVAHLNSGKKPKKVTPLFSGRYEADLFAQALAHELGQRRKG